ncbi:diacylglycerol/lipid kinase family protein [Deinococcus pimensis]|uniref:diacylglycerol/lipid kinase family protein n=1 Tax=Deinococcus pimensis TaxID=309888 RepID=UPI0004B70D84|nr:diacylglycerol kinase family protein [Deinococcus pimensis]
MQAHLIVNPNAGSTRGLDSDALTDALHLAGYDPVYRATADETELAEALDGAEGLVVVAGGDGTVRAAARHLVGRDVPLAVLPMGTANNIGRTLGLSGAPLDLVRGLAAPRVMPFDVGRVTGPWGEDVFLEAAGYGLYADALNAYDPDEGKSVPRALSALATTVGTYAPPDVKVTLDGVDLSGGYLLLEALNTQATGPRLRLAPHADPGDGLLDVVLVRAEGRDSLLAYLRGLLSDGVQDLPSVETHRGRVLTFGWCGQAVHVDGERRPAYPDGEPDRVVHEDGEVRVEVLPGALTLWLPGGETDVDERRFDLREEERA